MLIKETKAVKDGIKYSVEIELAKFTFIILDNGNVKILNKNQNKFLFYKSTLKTITIFEQLFHHIGTLQKQKIENEKIKTTKQINNSVSGMFDF